MPPESAPNHDRPDGLGRSAAPLADAEVARLVLQLDAAVTLKRRAGLARLVAHAEAVGPLPLQPSRMERAILIALVQSYGAATAVDSRFDPVLDFVAERGAVVLVQRVLGGEGGVGRIAADASVNDALAAQLKEARPGFEFLCGTWPDVFMAQAHAALTRLGLPTVAPPPSRELPHPPRAANDAELDDA